MNNQRMLKRECSNKIWFNIEFFLCIYQAFKGVADALALKADEGRGYCDKLRELYASFDP